MLNIKRNILMKIDYDFSLKLNSISNKSVMLFMEYYKTKILASKEKYVDFTEFTT